MQCLGPEEILLLLGFGRAPMRGEQRHRVLVALGSGCRKPSICLHFIPGNLRVYRVEQSKTVLGFAAASHGSLFVMCDGSLDTRRDA